MKQGYNAYRSANVDTADQGKLIIICYDVAIMHCKKALEKFDIQSLTEERTKHLFKVQDALTELISALRMDVGDVAKNLYRMYDYMLRGVVAASIKNDKEKINEILRYLESLRDAWLTAIQKIKSEDAPDLELSKMAVSG